MYNRTSEELFYQLGVRQFGDFSRMKLSPPPSLRTVVQLGISAEDIEGQTTLKREDIVQVSARAMDWTTRRRRAPRCDEKKARC